MPRKGENIYKRKDGRWEGRYIKNRTAQGKAVYESIYAKSYHAAKEKLRLVRSYQEGEFDDCGVSARPVEASLQGCRFGDLAWSWLGSTQPQVKASTYMKYKNLLKTYILPYFQTMEIRAFTADLVQKYCNSLLATGGARQEGLSAKTVNDVLVVIRSVLRYAQIKGLFPPCSGKEVSIKQTPGELCILQRDEQEKIYQYLVENPSNKNLGILICMLTGLRIGEICALKWSDISLTRKTIYVHQTMQRLQVEGDAKKKTAVIITAPKSACSIRTIPLPDNLLHIIERDYPIRQGYVLSGSDHEYIEPRALQRHFKRILEKNQIEPINFHALRHTFATRCVEVGFDAKSLSEILGHSSVSITMNRYIHPTMELKSENMQKLSALFAVK